SQVLLATFACQEGNLRHQAQYHSKEKGVIAAMAIHEHEKRPDIGPRFTESDPICLQWIGEQGGAQFGQVQKILARLSPNPEKLAVPGMLSVQRTRKKIARWKHEGLITYKTFLASEKGWVWLTKRGLEYIGLGDM